MNALIRILFPLIGYAATATVITIAVCFGYLMYTERLTSDKMFRIVALLQGVDLQQIAETAQKSGDEIPPEEPSLEALVGQQQVLDRNFEVKMLALQRGRQEYDHRLQQLNDKSEKMQRLAEESIDRLKQQVELTTQENLTEVVSNIEQLRPAVAKELLLRYIDEDRMADVITLLGTMAESKKAKILKTFTSDQELEKLYEILRLMAEDSANKEKYQQAIEEIQAVGQSGQ
jgi:ATP-dependent Lon protease